MTRPPRILQASRTGWLHTPVIFSASSPSTPFHPPKTSCAGRYNALDYSLDSIQPGAGASSPVLLEARPSRPHQSDSLPHTLTTRTTPALHSPSLLLDRRLRPVSVEPLHCDPLSSSKYPPRPVVAPPHKRSSGTSTHLSTEPRETATLLPPWNTGRSCIASGNVALWCEEFCLPIGMPGPVLQNLVISKPKVSLRILNDNHGHRPALT